MAVAQNHQPPKWMVFLLNMIISVGKNGTIIILSHCHILVIQYTYHHYQSLLITINHYVIYIYIQNIISL